MRMRTRERKCPTARRQIIGIIIIICFFCYSVVVVVARVSILYCFCLMTRHLYSDGKTPEIIIIIIIRYFVKRTTTKY